MLYNFCKNKKSKKRIKIILKHVRVPALKIKLFLQCNRILQVCIHNLTMSYKYIKHMITQCLETYHSIDKIERNSDAKMK